MIQPHKPETLNSSSDLSVNCRPISGII